MPTSYTTLEEWIAREAIQFSLDSSQRFYAAVDQMVDALGDAVQILGLGEALHGGEEILVFRNRLFQRLVEAHGYSAIAVESSFPRGRLINDYVLGQAGSSYDTVQERGFSHTFGRLDANRELVEWMRAYNANPAHRIKAHFYGFDTPTEMMGSDSPRQLLYFVLDYLASLDPAAGEVQRRRIEPLLGDNAAWENPMAMMDASQSIGLSPEATSLRIETENLASELVTRRPELIARSDKSRYLEALHYVASAKQLLTYHAGVAAKLPTATLLGQRDAAMADNLAYIAASEPGKVLAFAHNRHVQRTQAEWQWGDNRLLWWPAGAHLNAMLGAGYAVIGSALVASAENFIGRPESGTLESLLSGAPGPMRLIPTHNGRTLPAAEIAGLPMRSGSTKNFSYFALNAQSFEDFDWLFVLDSTTYTRGAPALQQWDAEAKEDVDE